MLPRISNFYSSLESELTFEPFSLLHHYDVRLASFFEEKSLSALEVGGSERGGL